MLRSRLYTMREMMKRGFQSVAAALDDGSLATLREHSILCESVNFKRGGIKLSDLSLAIELWRLYRRYRPSLVHHFNLKPIIFGTLTARCALWRKVKIVNTVTGVGLLIKQGRIYQMIFGLIMRVVCSLSDAIIFQNADDLGWFRDMKWVTSAKAKLVVSSGVDLKKFKPNLRLVRDRLPTIAMVSRLIRSKGVPVFLKAIPMVKNECQEVQFVLGGEWEEEHEDGIGKDEVFSLVKNGLIEFVGYVPRMEHFLGEIDAFVMPSIYREGVPRVVLEAAACGVPVIVSDSPGVRETVIDEETGLLLKSQKSEALADAILRLVRNPELRVRFGAAGRRFVEHRFDLRKISQAEFEIYTGIGVEGIDSELV